MWPPLADDDPFGNGVGRGIAVPAGLAWAAEHLLGLGAIAWQAGIAVAVVLLLSLAFFLVKGRIDRIDGIKALGQAMTVTAERERAHARLLELVAEIERGRSPALAELPRLSDGSSHAHVRDLCQALLLVRDVELAQAQQLVSTVPEDECVAARHMVLAHLSTAQGLLLDAERARDWLVAKRGDEGLRWVVDTEGPASPAEPSGAACRGGTLAAIPVTRKVAGMGRRWGLVACLLLLGGCGSRPIDPPTAVVRAKPSSLCLNDGFETSLLLDASDSTPSMTLVPVPADPDAPPLGFEWTLAGAAYRERGRDPDDIELEVVTSGERPLHVSLLVRNAAGGEASTTLSVPITMTSVEPCADAPCPAGQQCVEAPGARRVCVQPTACEADYQCPVCFLCDTQLSLCVPREIVP